MSDAASLADYRSALTTPGATGPVIAALFGRLPIAMVGISLLLYTQSQTGSFATAGLVSGAALIGVAMGSVAQGRIVDRFGPTRPLFVFSTVFAALAVLEVAAIELRAPVPTLVGCALALGLSQPQVGSASRALWHRLLPPGPARTAAYSYEAISMEVFFILGPGLAGLFVTAPWPGTGLVIGVATQFLGSVAFAMTRTVRAWGSRETAPAHSGGLLGAFARPAVRTVALTALGFGLVIGFIEVAVPASATAAGHPGVGGLLLSLWSVSSVLFGVLYGMRPWPRPLYLRLPVLLGGFALLSALLAIPTSLIGLAMVMVLVGTLITPQSTAHSLAIEAAAPPGAAAEAFGWVITSVTLGLAIGQSISGALVESAGPPVAFLCASAAGVVIALIVWLLRHTVSGRPPERQGTTVVTATPRPGQAAGAGAPDADPSASAPQSV
ncbi:MULTISPECIES: MFS transporter [Actinoalloteichus]|uniref:Major Facilitator Superfamily transporter n=1 Tax=Actinoalloteichus fjordicus TaxID=1612552 RepID=A0AAC9L8J3_9PSEU|nr:MULTISPECIES: MFS transporter [Actinoalloteichus]APU12339.1 Major Facilitator Superfamily transporter [Actinoalloteichus fjordicus]APU18291.1 Major Facilitator Superfamily transporter [Actinoalloteichus sp. GBA129-24]